MSDGLNRGQARPWPERARTWLISNLLTLSPHVQQALLLGDLHLSERRVRALVAGAEWWTIGDIGNTLF